MAMGWTNNWTDNISSPTRVTSPTWHTGIIRIIKCHAGTFVNSVTYPTWHNNIVTISDTVYCDPIIYSSQPIIFPEWHDNISMPSIIQERTEAKNAYLEQCHLEDAERQEKVRRQVAEEEEKRKIAAERANKILLEHLTPEQRETIEKNDWFIIEGGTTKKRYRVRRTGIAGNVEELEGEKVVAKYCCHIAHHYPRPDHHLAQKLMLEWDESEFLRLANRTAVR